MDYRTGRGGYSIFSGWVAKSFFARKNWQIGGGAPEWDLAQSQRPTHVFPPPGYRDAPFLRHSYIILCIIISIYLAQFLEARIVKRPGSAAGHFLKYMSFQKNMPVS